MEASTAKQPMVDSQSVTAGVLEDFEAFSEKFTAAKSVRYEHFLNIWKEMRMSLIFAGRQSDQECREFTEECLQLALTYSSSSHPFQVRVWALYMLYALYFKHPFYLRVKVRITLPEWRELLSLISEIREQQHLDAEYVFTRLRYDQAFHFVATKAEMYPGVRSQSGETDSQQHKLDLLMEEKSIVSQLFEPDTIDQLSAIHEEYHRVKNGLTADTPSVQQSLSVIENGLVQIVTKAIAGHEAWRKTKVGKKLSTRRRREDSGGAQSTSESEADSDFEQEPHSRGSPGRPISSVRAEIKNRAFTSSTASRRYRSRGSADSRRHTDVLQSLSASTLDSELGIQPSYAVADGDAEMASGSMGLTSMPLITANAKKTRKKKAAKNVKDGQQKCKNPVGRPRKSKPSDVNEGDAKRSVKRKKRSSSAAAAEAVTIGESDNDNTEKDGRHRKKRKKTTATSSQAAVGSAVGDEDGNKTVKRRKTGKKKTGTTSAAELPSPVATAAAETAAEPAMPVCDDDDKPIAVTRQRRARKKTTSPTT